jgi:hypothetical protein
MIISNNKLLYIIKKYNNEDNTHLLQLLTMILKSINKLLYYLYLNKY